MYLFGRPVGAYGCSVVVDKEFLALQGQCIRQWITGFGDHTLQAGYSGARVGMGSQKVVEPASDLALQALKKVGGATGVAIAGC